MIRNISGTLTIRQLTGYIKKVLESDTRLMNIWVTGEISNITRHSSGHLYFMLKDEECQLSCAMFRTAIRADASYIPVQGDKVLVMGSVNV